MAKCDFCKNVATHTLNSSDQVMSYLCHHHANKVVSTRYVMKQINEEPQLNAVCSLCGEEKPITEFYHYTDARGVKRRRGECKQCNLEERKKQRLRKK